MLNFPLFPVQASTFAMPVDIMYYVLSAVSTICTLAILAITVYMAVRFRRTSGANLRLSKPLHNQFLEITWIVVPTIVFLACFFWGALLFADYLKEPEGAMDVEVVAKQWMWKIRHPSGVTEVNELHVPIDQPVRLTMISQDVLHDFYVPEFRVKQDVVPGRFTKLWFEATRPGVYRLFCAEYCGTEHSLMGGLVYAMEPGEYAEWLKGGTTASPREAGALLFEQRGCVSCHASDTGDRGPDLAGLFGATRGMSNGERVVADENYIREAIMEPGKRVVAGFQPLMPSYVNQLTEEDVADLLAYIKSMTADVEE